MRKPTIKTGNARQGSRPAPAAPPVPTPVLARDGSGHWTLTYTGPAQDYWQVWARSSADGNWSNFGEIRTMNFPTTDADIVPDGVTWWQVKICGEDEDSLQCTPFSNVISFGPVPDA